MTILFYLIVFLHVIACLFLIAVVLLQQGKGQDLASAFGGGGTQTAFGPRGSATVLSRATTILAGLFMVTSLALSIVRPRAGGVLDQVAEPAAAASPSPAASVAPPPTTVPASSANTPASAPAEAPPSSPAPAASPSPR
jgi:preprotein translocase subunit SecG